MSPSTRDLILDASERLFAERGLDGVSLREIGAAAGQRNNSAVQYHFGTRGELIVAILGRHMPGIDARRWELLEQLGASSREPDLETLARIQVEPYAELLLPPTRYDFAQFVAHVDITGTLGDLHDLSVELTGAIRRVLELARPLLGHLDDDRFQNRVRLGTGIVVQAVGRRSRHLRAGTAELDTHDEFVADLSSVLASVVCAPVGQPAVLSR